MYRPEDSVLLGSHDEVVSGCGGLEGSLSASGQAECVAKLGYVWLSFALAGDDRL